ncbi:UPF0103-domain-containing protein [Rhizoclosmatium globosum]|uniref:UPF0103-domain-containing protein n=1 Tax=Rhizoclosmatium globosum TaxID=329046 RepID=A0A1Y2BEF5_9FUNG|nr:UPF0103-domain-containing protein [Rhizoclosmatium globosum]|eukprot:ORY33219.1 UPF0103-domain-containing protein [Rhizoclosmatium globosum]
MSAVRKASHAGSWYSSNPDDLSASLSEWIQEANSSPTPSVKPCRILILGPTAAHAYSRIDPNAVDTVFVLGPSHKVYLDGCALTRCNEYETPLGNLEINTDVVNELYSTGQFSWMSRATDENEHSIEMHLPFIKLVMDQKANGPYRIVPILVGSISSAKHALFGRILSPYFAKSNTLFVVSSDFCLDHEGMGLIEQLDVSGFNAYLSRTENTVCGRHPFKSFCKLLLHFDMRFVHYAQSGKVTTPRRAV